MRLMEDLASRTGIVMNNTVSRTGVVKDGTARRTGIAGDLFYLFSHNKWWWLTPMILVPMIFGGLILFAKSPPVRLLFSILF